MTKTKFKTPRCAGCRGPSRRHRCPRFRNLRVNFTVEICEGMVRLFMVINCCWTDKTWRCEESLSLVCIHVVIYILCTIYKSRYWYICGMRVCSKCNVVYVSYICVVPKIDTRVQMDGLHSSGDNQSIYSSWASFGKQTIPCCGMIIIQQLTSHKWNNS